LLKTISPIQTESLSQKRERVRGSDTEREREREGETAGSVISTEPKHMMDTRIVRNKYTNVQTYIHIDIYTDISAYCLSLRSAFNRAA